MRKYIEMMFYITFGAGMAFGTSSFTMMSGLFEITTTVWVIAAIWLSGLFCITISSSVAELASMYPSSPGVRTYLKVAFDNYASLLLVYLYLIFMVLIAGVESYMFALVVKAVFPNVSALLVVLLLLAFTIVTNLLGLELPRGLQILTTTVLILFVIAAGVWGCFVTPAGASSSLHLDLGGGLSEIKILPAAIAMGVYLFTGFEWVTLLGFSPKSYERRIPLSMPLAILTNVFSYSFFTLGLSHLLTRAEIAQTPIPQVPYFDILFGSSGVYIAWGLSALAIFSTFNAGIMGGSRLIYALTREGNLPKWCAKMSLRTGAPIGGVLVLGVLATISSVLILLYELELLAAVIGSSIVCFVYAAFMLAVIRLRRTQPAHKRTYRTPLPASVQWLVIFILPVMGILALVSQPVMRYQPLLGMICLFFISMLLAQWSLSRIKGRVIGVGS